MRTPLLLVFAAALLTNGCTQSSIDARKKSAPETEARKSKNIPLQLTDKDVFGNETTLAVSEEDIQAALDDEKLSVPPGSAIILIQSGSRAPETAMQQELSKYYRVTTFSGIPDRQRNLSCNKLKNDEGQAAFSENMNYMQSLRYIAAKGQQRTVLVYWDALQTGHYQNATKTTIWTDYQNETVTSSGSLRYLIRFALVDVATGTWATWSPINYEENLSLRLNEKIPLSQQTMSQLKQKTIAAVVKDLVKRYQ
ncbi:hypothetical protein KXR87_00020 [Yokenella regensburgei]|uniref:hypothetical protein n=1 Tax=Yokenella regensburgei TaxID=158877 RepID=UPI003F14D640